MAVGRDADRGRVTLASVIGGLTAALVRAQHLGDLEVSRLRDSRHGSDLEAVGVRSFEIADVTVELKCAIEGPVAADAEDLSIAIGPSALRGLEERHLSTLTLRFAASPIRVVSVAKAAELKGPAASGKVSDEA